MKLPARIVLIAVVAASAVGVVWAVSTRTPPAEVTVPAFERPAAAKPDVLKNMPVGMSGCLAAACHGGPATDTLVGKIDMHTWRSSGTAWIAADPHVKAYSLLTDNPLRPVKVTAAQIMSKYAPGTKATDDARCVACHTNPALASTEHMINTHAHALRTEGVSCEACHGNAGQWVSEHTTWRGKRDQVYAASGMVPLYDIGERALHCAGCHVGAPADPARGLPVRDMNHDMIAAGHPRLDFDFAEYLRRLPPHWQEKDRSTDPNQPLTLNPAKAWLVGRTAHAEAACKLLADRAERSKTDPRSPWPEFAEFNCAACHHQLKPPAEVGKTPPWRQATEVLDGRPAGSAPWQMIWPITPAAGLASPKRDNSPVHNLLELVEKPRFPRTGVPETARATAEALKKKRAEQLGLSDADAMKVVNELCLPAGADAPIPRVAEWDSAHQLYLGLAALERARKGNMTDAPPEFRKARDALWTKEPWPEFDWAKLTTALQEIRKKR